MCSSSPTRIPKLQLTAEQPLTGECWNPPQKDTPHPRKKEKHQGDDRRGEIAFRIKLHTCQRYLEGSDKTLCAPGPRDPTEPEPDLPLSVCLLWRHGSTVAYHGVRGSGWGRPGSRPHFRRILYQLSHEGSPKHTFIFLHITSSCTKLLEVVSGSCIMLFVLLHTLRPLPRTPVVFTEWSEWVKSLSRVWFFVTPWTVAYQAPPSMGFSRQEYWSGLPFPSPGDLPDPGIEPGSPALQADALTSEPPGKPCHASKVSLKVIPQRWLVPLLCTSTHSWWYGTLLYTELLQDSNQAFFDDYVKWSQVQGILSFEIFPPIFSIP